MDEEKYSELTPKNSPKETLFEVKEKLEVKKLKRKYFIEKVDDYSTLITTRIVGIGALVIGVSELLAPNLIPLILTAPITPFALISVSMAFLLKKRVISIMRQTLKTLAQYEEEDLK